MYDGDCKKYDETKISKQKRRKGTERVEISLDVDCPLIRVGNGYLTFVRGYGCGVFLDDQ